MSDTLKYDAQLYHWRISPSYYSTDGLPMLFCYGEVYNDKKERFYNGDEISTSRIKSIDLENSLLYTTYSVYKLCYGYPPEDNE